MLEAKSNSISIVAQGRGGWATTSYLSQIGKVLSALPKDAEIVIIQLGSNDLRMHGHTRECIEQTTANMGKLAELYQRVVPCAKIYIAAPPNMFPNDLTERLRKAGFGSKSPEYLKRLSDSYRRLARDRKLGFIDLYPAVSPGNTIDGAHPSPAGHVEIADAIWKVVRYTNSYAEVRELVAFPTPGCVSVAPIIQPFCQIASIFSFYAVSTAPLFHFSTTHLFPSVCC